MTKLKAILLLIFPLANITLAQSINWATLSTKTQHITGINLGLENGALVGVSYSLKFQSKIPLLSNTDFSIPAGNKAFDDFKVRTGASVCWYKQGKFMISTRAQGVFRRYENSLVRIVNFGSDIGTTLGFYKKKWFTNAELSFDKAIVNHFKHTDEYKAMYPKVRNGWFEPSAGGIFYYGLQGGYSWINRDITLRIGKTITQDFKTTPFLPLYFQFSYQVKFPE